METINLALVGLAAPSRIERREPGARFTPHVALVGAAIELALAACLVQVHGDRALFADADEESDNTEPAARKGPEALLADFQELLRDPPPRARFLTEGVAHAPAHLRRLLDMSQSFERIFAWRRRGLESGEGPNREACSFAAARVVDFLEALAQSSRVRPYLETLPRPRGTAPGASVDVAFAKRAQGVLPEGVMPADAMPVRLDPDNPEAIPVAPGFLQQSFSRRRDQWRADVGIANARLERGTLDLPPRESVLTCFALGADALRDMLGVGTLGAEHVWPFIASSLNQRGTAGPYWFLVRAVTHDLGALHARMSEAFGLIGGITGERRRREFLAGLEAIDTARPLGASTALSVELRDALDEIGEHRRGLLDNLARAEEIEREVPDAFARLVRQVAAGQSHAGQTHAGQTHAGQTHAGEALEALSAGEHSLDQPTRQYWARVISASCSELDDRMGLIGVLQHDELHHAHSSARKALRWIDALAFGPRIDGPSSKLSQSNEITPRPEQDLLPSGTG